MSNLSELLPAGSSVKSADFVAQGTLASGVTVALRSDGKVEAISATGGPASAGTPVEFETGSIQDASSALGSFWAAYDYTNDRVVVAYCDTADNYYGKAAVGTVSGSAISFGTPVNFNNGVTYDTTTVFASNQSKIIISYRDGGNSNYGTSIVGTVSGTSISFGTEVVYNSDTTQTSSPAWSEQYQRYVISFLSGQKGRYAIASLSGTTLSFGSVIVFYDAVIVVGAGTVTINNTDETNTGNILIGYVKDGSSGEAIVGQLQSSTSFKSLSFGTPVVFNTPANTTYLSGAFDSTNKKMVLSFQQGSAGNYAKCVVGTVSGTSLSFGTAVVFTTSLIYYTGTTFDSAAGKIIIGYRDATIGGYGRYVRGAVSGTSISFESPVTFSTVAGNTAQITLTYDSDTQQPVVAYAQFGGTNNGAGTAAVLLATSSNAADFIGITDQAISSAATGKVVCKGGAITNTGLIPSVPVAGTAVVFKAGRLNQTASAFDSTNNKIVISYKDYNNSFYGTAIVGTVSGSSISFGTAVVFEAAGIQFSSVVFDSTNNKIVIFYEDDANNDYGTAVVGTVSGTSISFGTPVVFDSVNMQFTGNDSAVYDSANNRAVVFYRNASGYEGYAAVGTVSGTSISFGTPVKFSSGAAELNYINATFDSAANKIVTSYRVNTETNHGKAIVGTVSGTSISFGSEVVFDSGGAIGYISGAFDSSQNKVVLAYQDGGNSNAATAIVGTVSGTSISFGTKVVITPYFSSYFSATFDSNKNTVLIAYQDATVSGSGQVGTIAAGTVSGTSISFGTPVVFNSTASSVDITSAFDSNLNKTVISYQDGTGGSQVGESVVIDLSSDLTPNTAYFVQDDGTISTSSTSTKAGTALSTTSLLLTG